MHLRLEIFKTPRGADTHTQIHTHTHTHTHIDRHEQTVHVFFFFWGNTKHFLSKTCPEDQDRQPPWPYMANDRAMEDARWRAPEHHRAPRVSSAAEHNPSTQTNMSTFLNKSSSSALTHAPDTEQRNRPTYEFLVIVVVLLLSVFRIDLHRFVNEIDRFSRSRGRILVIAKRGLFGLFLLQLGEVL